MIFRILLAVVLVWPAVSFSQNQDQSEFLLYLQKETVSLQQKAQQDRSNETLNKTEGLFRQAQEVLGPDAPQLLNIMMFLVQLRSNNGELDRARILAERSYELALANFPEHHPGNIAIASDLAKRVSIVDPARARSLGRKAFEAAAVSFGPEHQATAFYGANYGALLISFKEYRLAERPLLTAVEFFDKQRAGIPKDVMAYANLAISYYFMGEREKAVVFAEKAASFASTQGILHAPFLRPHPLFLQAITEFELSDPKKVERSKHHLHIALQNTDVPFGQILIPMAGSVAMEVFTPSFPDNIEFLRLALEVARSDDQISLKSELDLTRLLADLTPRAESTELRRHGFQDSLEKFGARHPITIEFQIEFANGLLFNQSFDEARKLLLPVLEFDDLKEYGELHLSALSTLALLEMSSEVPHAQKADNALQYAEAAYEIAKQTYGADNPGIVFPAKTLVEVLFAKGRFKDADIVLEEVLGNAAVGLGVDKIVTAELLGHKAMVLAISSKPAEAEVYLKRSLNISNEIPDLDASSLIPRKFLFLNLKMMQNRLTPDVRDLAQEVYDWSLNNLGREDPSSILAEGYLVILEAMENEDAVQGSIRMKTLIAKSEKILGEDHEINGLLQEILSFLLVEVDPVKAVELFLLSRGEKGSREHVGANSISLFTMAVMLDDNGLSAQAAPFYQKALKSMSEASASELAKMQKFARFAAHLSVRDPDAIDLGEGLSAFEIMQWSQERKAGQALRSAAARLASIDVRFADLLRERQDLEEALDKTEKDLTTAFAKGSSQDVVALQRQKKVARQKLQEKSSELEALGGGTEHLTQSKPLTEQEAASLLQPGEALLYLTPTEFTEDRTALPGLAFLVRWDGQTISAALDPYLIHSTGISGLRCNILPGVGNCANQGTLLDQSDESQKNVQRSAEALKETTEGFSFGLAHSLYRDMIGPVESGLKDVDHLVVVAGDETLASLPIQMLVKKPIDDSWTELEALKNADWLIRDFAVSNLPSVSSLATLRQATAKKSIGSKPFLGVGDPVIGEDGNLDCEALQISGLSRSAPPLDTSGLSKNGGEVSIAVVDAVRKLPRLADTRCELESVRDYLGGGALLLGQEATETQLKSLNSVGGLSDYKVLSFATHGLVAGESGAQESALVMTPPQIGTLHDDGLLTASEIAAFDLDADIVILSACNTASGLQEGEEALSGLARAFFYAGARTLIVSHWPVDSDAAVRLSTNTFKTLETSPESGPSKALQQAILEILDDPTSTKRELNPKHWAPFILVGSGL